MVQVTAGELQKKFGQYRAIAYREPVMVSHHGRDDLVLISNDEYTRLKDLEQRTFHVSQLTDDELAEIDSVVIPAEAAQYNNEVE